MKDNGLQPFLVAVRGVLRSLLRVHKVALIVLVLAVGGLSLWAILKRGIYGIYHHVSVKYLQNYVNEFCFRFNNRDSGDMFDLALKQARV